MNEMFETLPNTDAGEDENAFERAVTALTNYFTPKKDPECEVYVFRKAKQESEESVSAFHTRLRRLAMTGSQKAGIHATGKMHLGEVASGRTVVRGIHIRDKKIPALLMENLAMDVENKTSMQTQKS